MLVPSNVNIKSGTNFITSVLHTKEGSPGRCAALCPDLPCKGRLAVLGTPCQIVPRLFAPERLPQRPAVFLLGVFSWLYLVGSDACFKKHIFQAFL